MLPKIKKLATRIWEMPPDGKLDMAAELYRVGSLKLAERLAEAAVSEICQARMLGEKLVGIMNRRGSDSPKTRAAIDKLVEMAPTKGPKLG